MMNQLFSDQVIKELCGDHAYKKGKGYFQKGKAAVTNFTPNTKTFNVNVNLDNQFHVTIEHHNGQVSAECTCPKLASITQYCQHVAAALFAINAKHLQHVLEKQQGDSSTKEGSFLYERTALSPLEEHLTNQLFGLFTPRESSPKSRQHLIEEREQLIVEFTCIPYVENGMFAIELKLGTKELYPIILDEFLHHFENSAPYEITNDLTYDRNQFYLHPHTDTLIKELLKVYKLENYIEETKADRKNHEPMLIPPSFWDTIFPFLLSTPNVKIINNRTVYHGIEEMTAQLPLTFSFAEKLLKGNYQLFVNGFERLKMMKAYRVVLYENKIKHLAEADYNRLIELKDMLETNEKQDFLIPIDQIKQFVDQVMPGFMKLGKVQLSKSVLVKLNNTPLKAKLYLDRIHNKLLAGLEFHYGQVVINPLDDAKEHNGITFLREDVKEQRILQLMDDSMFSKTEGGYYLQNEELEYHFLYHFLPLLKPLVEVYATSAVRTRLFKDYSHPNFRVKLGERTNWLSFQFDIGGIPESDIKGILKSLEIKRPYYRLSNGSLLSLESPEFTKVTRFLQGLDIEADLFLPQFSLPIGKGMQQLDVLGDKTIVTLEPSFQKLLDDLQNPQANFAIPEMVGTSLRKYQTQGYTWLKTMAQYGFGGILADDMGLGKTIQSIAFISSVLTEIRKQKLPTLIVSPSSLVYNWKQEFNNFAPAINVAVVTGTIRDRENLLKNSASYDVMITSYPLVQRDSTIYKNHHFHTLILDEAQFVKNFQTKTAKTIKLIKAANRFALTGTPIENSIIELWSIFHLVFPDLFPDRKEFLDLPRETIAKKVRPFILRRLKTDVLDELPEKFETVHTSELLPEQKKLYLAYLAKLKHDTFKHLDKETFEKNRIKILAGITRLRQICCHPGLFVDGYKGSSAKLEQLLDIVMECHSTGKRILLFSQFTKMLEIIGRELTNLGLPYFYLDGQTPSSERIELCNKFNNGERGLFLISLKAGGTGLNLTGADTVILYDLWWNPAVEQQAADRAYRMGQTRNVHVIKLVAKGTVEDKMNALQLKKKHLIEEVIKPGNENISTLTREDVQEILSGATYQ